MTDADCPYLLRETIAYRESLDLSREAPHRIIVMWSCSHPFHGIRLELGDVEADMRSRCSACTLPRFQASRQNAEPSQRQMLQQDTEQE